MFRRHRYVLVVLFLIGAATLAFSDAAAQSAGIIEGQVVDAGDGSPLPGANVVVEGTSIGTSTDPVPAHERPGRPADPNGILR